MAVGYLETSHLKVVSFHEACSDVGKAPHFDQADR